MLTASVRRTIKHLIHDRFPGKVDDVEIDLSTDDSGDTIILIRIFMTSDTTDEDFAGRFFGLTGQVRSALGEDMQGVFPVIRPVEAHV